MGSIPIARSKSSVDAVGFPDFPTLNRLPKRRVFDSYAGAGYDALPRNLQLPTEVRRSELDREGAAGLRFGISIDNVESEIPAESFFEEVPQ
jgi:hypothetical protein